MEEVVVVGVEVMVEEEVEEEVMVEEEVEEEATEEDESNLFVKPLLRPN